MRQSLPVMVTIKVNRVCRLGWRGLPERVDYAPTSGKQELFPSATLELCDVPCTVRELRTRVDLATRYEYINIIFIIHSFTYSIEKFIQETIFTWKNCCVFFFELKHPHGLLALISL